MAWFGYDVDWLGLACEHSYVDVKLHAHSRAEFEQGWASLSQTEQAGLRAGKAAQAMRLEPRSLQSCSVGTRLVECESL